MEKNQLQQLSLEEKRALLKEMLREKQSQPAPSFANPSSIVPGLLESAEYAAFQKQKILPGPFAHQIVLGNRHVLQQVIVLVNIGDSGLSSL